MTQDGASDPADLVLFPLLFVLVLLAASMAAWLIRRLFPRAAKAPDPDPVRLSVDDAVLQLESAGLDLPDLLGDWLPAISQCAGTTLK
jgi:hypothetical protein